MTPIDQELGSEISRAVEQIVAASHAAATQALNQAFGRGMPRSSSASKQNVSPGRVGAVHRTQEQLQVLKACVYQALCDSPGQTMADLASQVGLTPRELQFPIARLKSEGLVKAVGQRQSMRYFPKNTEAPLGAS